MRSILVCTTHKSSVVKCLFSEKKSRFIHNTKILWQFSFCVKLACLATRYMDSFEITFLYFPKKFLRTIALIFLLLPGPARPGSIRSNRISDRLSFNFSWNIIQKIIRLFFSPFKHYFTPSGFIETFKFD